MVDDGRAADSADGLSSRGWQTWPGALVLVADGTGRVAAMNPAAERLLGAATGTNATQRWPGLAQLFPASTGGDGRHPAAMTDTVAECTVTEPDGAGQSTTYQVMPIPLPPDADGSAGLLLSFRAVTGAVDASESTRATRLAATIGRVLTRGDDLRTQLQECARVLVEHFDAAFARIWTLNGAEQMLHLQASAGMYTHLDGAHGRVPVGALKIGRIAAEARPHLTNQVLDDPRISDPEWARREGLIAFAGYPLRVGDRVVGVMALFARHRLPETALDALGSVADEIAIGIARAQAHDDLQRSLVRERAARDELEAIHQIGMVLAAELDLERLLQAITDAATELAGAQFGAFFYNVVRANQESYVLYTISGVEREAFSKFPMPRNTAVFGPTFRGEGVVRLDDVRQDPRYGQSEPYRGMPPGHLPVVSYLAVPVMSRSGEVLGGLFFGHAEAGVFTEREERLVIGLAAQSAIALDNARLYQQAYDLLRTRDEFLSAAAHDLKTPLAAIKGGAQVLQRSLDRGSPIDPARLKTQIGGLNASATKLTRLVDQLLDVARIQSGQMPSLERRPVDLVPLATRAAEEHQQSTERHQIRVESSLPEAVGPWDTARLERVLDNLLSNAVKYSPGGGDITVRIAADPDRAGWVHLAVEDSGLGIPAADLPRIFERFYRAGNVASLLPGTGIGLAGTRQIVEWHGGALDVRSEEGVGTTFIVCLPCYEAGLSATIASNHLC